jgi:hypothetical protein
VHDDGGLGFYPHEGGGDHAGPMLANADERLQRRPFFYPRDDTDRIFPAVMINGGSDDLTRARLHNIHLHAVGYHGDTDLVSW